MASTPAAPTTEIPAKLWIVVRSTSIVSVAESTRIPEMGPAVEIVPALRTAVIVSVLDAAEYVVFRSVICTPAGSSVSTTSLFTRPTTMSSAANIARDSRESKPRRFS